MKHVWQRFIRPIKGPLALHSGHCALVPVGNYPLSTPITVLSPAVIHRRVCKESEYVCLFMPVNMCAPGQCECDWPQGQKHFRLMFNLTFTLSRKVHWVSHCKCTHNALHNRPLREALLQSEECRETPNTAKYAVSALGVIANSRIIPVCSHSVEGLSLYYEYLNVIVQI